MKRYEVSVGNSHRGENKSFWFYKNALYFAQNNSSPFVSIIDLYSKRESESINWVDTDQNIQYINKEPIKVNKLRFKYDGMNVNYLWTIQGTPPKEIKEGGHTFTLFAVNGYGQHMYLMWD